MKKNNIIWFAAVFCMLNFLSYSQEIYDMNLLVNGDAEDFSSQAEAPGWLNKFGDDPETETYGHTGGEFDWDWGKPKGYGDGYFRASVMKSDPKYLEQEINLSSAAGDIREGKTMFTLSGYFGGGEGAGTRLEAVFVDKDGKKISAYGTPFVKDSEKSPELDLFPRSISGTVPKESASVKISLHFEYPGECGNCSTMAIADNLSFTLNKK